ncbi:Muramoyltetrapeptide carboxypeptidase [Arcticibacter svalbardensis MN12-7]|uniref:Muramoyltetrapeptide carboxypeptidase n=1 Tax=Arcticibacter svalbardensis MN12-7 TaxID=1150600 RepID=R9GVM4_9SPHI|nr:LD-carboxypeptidase [Arcticibacter svalbardensis]EOR95781.1 Muramoyltetrapeptide carboxypeptidase [Arcticibacter svalbardensis MN12-7]
MNRKNFITSLVTAGGILSTCDAWAAPTLSEMRREHKIPPYLKAGDSIGITSPAGYISLEAIHPSVQLMESWGFKVVIGTTIGKKDYTYGGTDEERRLDFQMMLDSPEIKAIMCARGGYGFVRFIDQINFKDFVRNPKWLIGFSDITVLHAHVNQNFGIATLHSKMCNSFPDDWAKAEPIQISTILSIKQALGGEKLNYTATGALSNRYGRAEGPLVGGNLSIIHTLAGTPSDLDTRGKILFVEDTKEQLYSIDRMFWNLKRTGKLAHLAGLIIGGFNIKTDAIGEEFGQSVYEMVMEKVKEYTYPVCFDFPVGHQLNNFALKCNVKHELMVGQGGSTLKEV